MRICCCIVILLAVLGCHQSHAGGTQEKPPPTVESRVQETEPKWLATCWQEVYPETWIDSILVHPRGLLKLHDNCVILALDSLGTLVKTEQCQKCLEALNAVSNISDGYVSEIIVGEVGTLYYESLDLLLKFLINPQYESDRLFTKLVYSFSVELEDDAAPEQRREEIIRDIQLKMLGRTTPEKKLLERLIQKVREIKVWEIEVQKYKPR